MPADLGSVAVRPAAHAHAADWVWIGVLALTATFQFGRGAPVDGAVFGAAALLLILDTVGVLPEIAPTRLPPLGILLVAALAGAVVLIVAPFAGPLAAACVVLIGFGCVPFVWPRAARPAAASAVGAEHPHKPPVIERRVLRRTGVLWAVLAVLVCLWELTAFFLGAPSTAAELAHPTISSLVEPFVAWPWGRPIFVVLWLLGGIALLRIGHRKEVKRSCTRLQSRDTSCWWPPSLR